MDFDATPTNLTPSHLHTLNVRSVRHARVVDLEPIALPWLGEGIAIVPTNSPAAYA